MVPQSQPSSEGQSQARDRSFLFLLTVVKVKKCIKAYRNITQINPNCYSFITIFFCYIRFIFYSQLLKTSGMREKLSSDLEKRKDTQSHWQSRARHNSLSGPLMAVSPCFGQLFLQGLWRSVDGLRVTKKTSLTLLSVRRGGY